MTPRERLLWDAINRLSSSVEQLREALMPTAIHFPEAQTPLEDCIRYPMPPDVRDER